jgi:hypothetical protein
MHIPQPRVLGQLSVDSPEQDIDEEIVVRPWDEPEDEEEEFNKLLDQDL